MAVYDYTAMHVPPGRVLATVAAIFVSCLLYGCIEVEDFGDYWGKGFIDSCVNDIVMQSMAEDSDEEDVLKTSKIQLRSLKVGKHLFLMMRDHPEDKGGNLIRYQLAKDEYVSYRLNEAKRKEFLLAHPDNPLVAVSDETATIHILNSDSIALIESVAGDESYWLETMRKPYNPDHRSDCIKQPK